MKKDDIFEITTSDGVEILGIVVNTIIANDFQQTFLCYSQNRLFTVIEQIETDYETREISCIKYYDGIVADYVIIPKYDEILKDYDYNNMMKSYSNWEETFEKDIQDIN